jgi:regulatory protein
LARGHGERRIRADLSRRGIARELVESALEAAGGRERAGDACIEALHRRFARQDLADPKQRARAFRYLAGRGFDAGQIHAALAAREPFTEGEW